MYNANRYPECNYCLVFHVVFQLISDYRPELLQTVLVEFCCASENCLSSVCQPTSHFEFRQRENKSSNCEKKKKPPLRYFTVSIFSSTFICYFKVLDVQYQICILSISYIDLDIQLTMYLVSKRCRGVGCSDSGS